MRKHRGNVPEHADSPEYAERKAPSPDAWLPVLTDIVRRGSPPPPADETHSQTEGDVSELSAGTPALEETNLPLTREAGPEPEEVHESAAKPATEPEPVPAPESAIDSLAETKPDEHVAKNLVDELTPKISSLMQEQVAEELRKSLNQSMATLMANLNANVEEIVRQAVTEKLAEKDKKPS